MKKIIFIFITVCMFVIYGCENMNDRHNKYLAEGEIIYIGKVDSVKAFSGDERVIFRYWLGDPRAKSLTVSWSNGAEYVSIPILPHAAADSFDVQIGKNGKNIAEGNYTFQWVSRDDFGNTSVIFEKNAVVYGARYKSSLMSHIILNARADGNNVVITWGGSTNEQETGVTIKYKTGTGATKTSYYKVDELTTTVLENADFSVRPQYQTTFLPSATAIDTFYTGYVEIPFSAVLNVALNKPVKASDILDPNNAAQQPSNAVDGNYATTATRWVSTDSGEHWLEIDLLGQYTINSFKTWNGSGDYNYPIAALKLQAWIDGNWVDVHSVTGNTNAQYGADFAPVSTTKVRFYTYNQVRLFQIAVYSIVNY